MSEAYIDDHHYRETSDSDKAMATHLRELARRLEKTAKRYDPDCDPRDALWCKNDEKRACTIRHCEDIALEEQVIKYIKQNYRQIGDMSMVHGLIKLVRHGSQIYRVAANE